MIVAFRAGTRNPLLLSHVKIKDDKIERAYVNNGAWEFSRVNGILCIEGDPKSPMEDFETLVDVPLCINYGDDYNAIIEWARNEVSS
ncbi:hypothetical protein Asfd1_76 [Aeromonas phage Asfd_1]|nr:hypothetical protein Asfd1_76 [Aeromonas phage Asfd_1]